MIYYYYWRRNVMFLINYADDTSILCKHKDYDSAYNDLLSAAMQANPEKIQYIIFDK